MSALTFTLKKDLVQKLDVSSLTPDLLADKPLADISATLLWYGKQQIPASDAFAITGSETNNIVFDNSTALKLYHNGSREPSSFLSS